MTLFIRAAFLMIALVWAGVGLAQDAKIAVVNLQRLTVGSDEGKKSNDKLEKKYQEIAGIMQKAQKDIEDKENRLRTQERIMSDANKAQLAREIERDKTDLTRKNQDYQKELAELEEQLMAPLMEQAKGVLASYLKEYGYTIIFNLTAEDGNVVWYNQGNDITDDVITRINAQQKAGPPVAATPATGR